MQPGQLILYYTPKKVLPMVFQAAPTPVFFQAAPAPRSQKHPAPTGSGSGSPALALFSEYFHFISLYSWNHKKDLLKGTV